MPRKLALAFLATMAIALPLTATLASPAATERVSVDSAGNQGDNYSYLPAISADGRYVAFQSYASKLVPGETNNPCALEGRTLCAGIFVHDRRTGKSTLVSVDSAGNPGNGESGWPAISADGRYVAFHSYATNLVPGDTNGKWDVFVHDRQTGTTERVSVDSAGNQANGNSASPAITADGRYVAFQSDATNLVPAGTNGTKDIFVHDRETGQTTLVSVDSAGNQGNRDTYLPAISADGRYVAFQLGEPEAAPWYGNSASEIFVHDRQTGTTDLVSVDSADNQRNANSQCPCPLTSDGRYVAFQSGSANLVPGDTNDAQDIFVRDRQTGTTERVSVDSAGNQGNRDSASPAISADGRYVAFDSYTSDLVPGDTNNYCGRDGGINCSDVFVHDRQTGVTERVSVDSAGNEGNGDSTWPAITPDGRYAAFVSWASNLVPGDTNAMEDIFVHDRGVVSDKSGWSAAGYAALAAGLGATFVTLAAGAWYASTRRDNA